MVTAHRVQNWHAIFGQRKRPAAFFTQSGLALTPCFQAYSGLAFGPAVTGRHPGGPHHSNVSGGVSRKGPERIQATGAGRVLRRALPSLSTRGPDAAVLPFALALRRPTPPERIFAAPSDPERIQQPKRRDFNIARFQGFPRGPDAAVLPFAPALRRPAYSTRTYQRGSLTAGTYPGTASGRIYTPRFQGFASGRLSGSSPGAPPGRPARHRLVTSGFHDPERIQQPVGVRTSTSHASKPFGSGTRCCGSTVCTPSLRRPTHCPACGRAASCQVRNVSRQPYGVRGFTLIFITPVRAGVAVPFGGHAPERRAYSARTYLGGSLTPGTYPDRVSHTSRRVEPETVSLRKP